MIKTLLNIQTFGEPKQFVANVEDVIKKHTSEDGVIDYVKANEEMGLQVSNYTKKNTPNIDDLKLEAADQVKSDYIKELNINGVESPDQFIAWKNLMSSEDWQVKLSNQDAAYKDLETKYNELNGNYTKSTQELTKYQREQFLLNKNASIEDVDYLSFKIGQLVTEEVPFDKAWEDYAKNNPKYFGVVEPKKPITTGVPRVPTNSYDNLTEVEKILIAKGKMKPPTN